MEKTEKLYFIQDLSFGSPKQVYAGSSGTGKKFQIFQSDYGKYAMIPQPKSKCQEMIKDIEKAAKGKSGKGTTTFEWNLIPMTEINLCNFYEDTDWNQDAYDKLQEEQRKIK